MPRHPEYQGIVTTAQIPVVGRTYPRPTVNPVEPRESGHDDDQ